MRPSYEENHMAVFCVERNNKNISQNDKNVLTNKNNCYNIPSTGKILQSCWYTYIKSRGTLEQLKEMI